MVDKFFLGLDYETDDEALTKGLTAIDFLRNEFGREFVERKIGVKINQDLLTGRIDPRHREFPDNGNDVFADLKLGHGYDTGQRIVRRIIDPNQGNLPIRYFTVSANMGATILWEYVKFARRKGINVIAFTAHTKIPPEEVRRMYKGENLDDAIFNLGEEAYQGGCHAIVLEGGRLQNERVRRLPLKKLVTGIRIDPSDKGTQSRVTALDDLGKVKQHVDYVVVSSRYVSDPRSLGAYFSALL